MKLPGLILPVVLCSAVAAALPAQEPLRLPDIFRRLDSANPRLVASRAMARAAAARAIPARTLPDPSLQFALMNRNLPGLGLSDPLGMNQVQLMQMVPIAGQLGLAGRSAAATAGAAEVRTADLRWELRADAAMLFYELYRLDRGIAIVTGTQGLLREIGTTARTMYAVGEGRQADVLRAQVEVDRMTEEVARMGAMRTAAAARLNALLDLPDGTVVPTPELPALPEALPGSDSLQRLALSRRPMLAAGSLEVEAAKWAERRARREIWPDLQLGVQYGQRPMAGGGTDRMLSLMVGFSVPVWAGRRQLQMRREMSAMREAAEADLAAMQAETRGRVAGLAADLERVRTLRALYVGTILPQAEATVVATLAAYRVGEVDLPMLLDARMAVNNYRLQLLELEAEEGTTMALLEMATGGIR